jgi:Fimbrial assembly protein (PilN)
MPQNINLYVAKPKPGQHTVSRAGFALIAALLVAGGALLHRIEAGRVDQVRASLAPIAAETGRLQRLLAEVPSPGSQIGAQIEAEEAQVAALESTAARLSGQSLGASRFSEQLRGFGRTTLDGVWLTGIRLDRYGSITLDGRALDAARVPAYIGGLQKESQFGGTAFAAIELKALDQREVPLHAVAFRLQGADMQAVALRDQKDYFDRLREREQKIRRAAIQSADATPTRSGGTR